MHDSIEQTDNTTGIQRPVSFQVKEEVLGGFAAGVVGTLLGFPLDLVKTRMQTRSASSNKHSPLSLLRHILRTEGLSSIYKGVGPPLVSLSIVNTLSFTSYSYFRQNHFRGTDGWDYRNALSGMMGAPLFGIVTTPENFLKTQMQLDNVQSKREELMESKSQQSISQTNQTLQKEYPTKQPSGRFTNSFHCAKTLASTHGATVLYTGHAINTIREAAFVGTYFFCYEGYKSEFRKLLLQFGNGLGRNVNNAKPKSNLESSSSITSLAIPMAGGCAGATAWAFTFPLDCVRAGVQGQLIPPHANEIIQKQGAYHVLKNLWLTKGFWGLYAGVGPSVARAFLVSGSRFSAYEGALWLCRWSGLTSAGEGEFGEEGPGAYDD
mmetsp:Transcript_1051/g.2185  ORF Transcript_1051/g.2185 Transcript_1051/m.2185 type:complete len:379 (+) Transcript_1051:132-1268(+)